MASANPTQFGNGASAAAGTGTPRDTRTGSDIRSVLRVLRRRGILVVLCCLAGAGVAVAVSITEQKQYTATAVLYFQATNFDEALFGSASPVIAPSSDPARQGANDLGLATLQTVAALTAKDLRLPTSTVTADISVSAQGTSDLIDVAATTRDPALASRIATAYAHSFVRFRRKANQGQIAAAESLVAQQLNSLSPAESRGPEGSSLRNRRDELSILASLQTGGVQVVQNATVPTSPSSPHPKRSGALGAGLGLLVGIALLLLLERLDRRVRVVEELEQILELPVLSVVPQNRTYARRPGAQGPSTGPISDVFYLLRAKLRYFNVDREIRSVLVTSAAPKDGKSTVAWHLALAAAAAGPGKVLLLEADLRRPTLISERGFAAGPGLAEVLSQGVAVRDVIRTVPARGTEDNPDSTLDVIPAGYEPPNATELLESQRMSRLLEMLVEHYETVVIDTPPTSLVSDAMPLVPHVDGVIVVGRLHQTTRDALQRLRKDLVALRAPLLGVVVNGLRGKDADHYGYGYGRGYDSGYSRSTESPRSNGATSISPRRSTADR